MNIDLLILIGIATVLYATLHFRGSRFVLASVLSATFSLYSAQYLFNSGILTVSFLVQKIIIGLILIVGITSFASVLKTKRIGFGVSKKIIGMTICALSALYIVGMYIQLIPGTFYEFSEATRGLYDSSFGFTGALFLIPFLLPFLIAKVD